MLVILLLLKGKPRIFLVQMCTLTASVVVYCFLNVCRQLIPSRIVYGDEILAPIVCHLWSSRYLSLVCYTFAILILNFTVGNRAIQISCKYQYSFSTSLLADIAYLGGMGLVSLIAMVPQAYIVQWDGNSCKCVDKDLPYGILVFLYTGNFVRFGLTAVISLVILSLSCYKIIYWVRNTPADQLFDTWNILSLPGTTKEQIKAFGRPQGWLTATLCTVPLSVNLLAISIFDTGRTLLCSLGLCIIHIDSPISHVIELLLDIQLLLVPVIFTIYIPAVRQLVLRGGHMITFLCRRLRN
ncbi:unnamed protein product [Dibothriocephalus latus]|uniref:G-protein coupled receptors family 1 profile domain-containing protein n=1 Tax=Dibothriocephalus latus TaxID=60516 RepID=A0A3P7NM46_DIBLA|nr:unnamed protein product [Dibothriocephalus latus]